MQNKAKRNDLPGTLAEAISRSAHDHYDRIAIIHFDRVLSYRQFYEQSLQISSTLEKGSPNQDLPVACVLSHGVNSILGLCAAWLSGRTCFPISSRLSDPQTLSLIDHSTAQLILTDSAQFEKIRELVSSKHVVLNIEDVPAGNPASFEFSFDSQQNSRSAVVVNTSGTTGAPKGVVHSNKSLLFNAVVHTDSLGLSSSDRALLLAHNHTISGITDVLRMLLNGGSLIPVDLQTTGIAGVLSSLREFHPTVVHFVPTIFRRILNQSNETENLFDSVRVLHLGGEPVTRYDFECFCRYFPTRCLMLNNLGCSEVPTFRQSLLRQDASWEGTLVPLNREVPEKDVQILAEESTKLLPTGEIGEIAIRSQFCASGYWRDTKLTAEKFQDVGNSEVLYRTGDYGRLQPDGTLDFLNRKDGQIKHLGQKIDLLDLETKLARFSGVEEVCIVTLEKSGQHLLFAFVSGSPQLERDWLKAVSLETSDSLPNLRIEVLDHLPILNSGKIDRKALRKCAKELLDTASGSDFLPLKSTTEHRVAKIWKNILSLDVVGGGTNFFLKGGDSLAVFDCMAQVEQEFGKRVEYHTLLKYPNLADFSQSIDQTSHAVGLKKLVQIREASSSVQILFIGMAPRRSVIDSLPEEYSISVLRIDGYDLASFKQLTIEEIAQESLEELRLASSPVPTAIIGFSYYGLVAYTLAQKFINSSSHLPTVLLIEPSTPLSSSLVGIMKEKGREVLRRLLPGKHHRYNLQKLLAVYKSGIKLTAQEHWELIRPTVRRNRRLVSLQEYAGDVILVGRQKHLRSTRIWQTLASNNLQEIMLPRIKTHMETLDLESEKKWLKELVANIDSKFHVDVS